MATITPKFRPSASDGQEGYLFYQIIHDRHTHYSPSGLRLSRHLWDERRLRPSAAALKAGIEQAVRMSRTIDLDRDRFARILSRLEKTGISFSVEQLAERFEAHRLECSLFRLMDRAIARLKANGKMRTAETYRAALNSFSLFRNGADTDVDAIDSDLMQDYSAWLSSRGLVRNTISFYNRILRAVYNRAVDQGLTDNRHPFRHVYTGIEKTQKRAITTAQVGVIRRLILSSAPQLDFARDMFMLSFYLRGMSLVDMAHLRRSDLSNGTLRYKRRKTGHSLSIGWTREMQTIIDKHPSPDSRFLLPLIPAGSADTPATLRAVSYRLNRDLHRIGLMAGLAKPLTLYVARHSWASAARSNGVPVSVISEGMGHNSELTTRIYLASLDTSTIDNANAVIIASV